MYCVKVFLKKKQPFYQILFRCIFSSVVFKTSCTCMYVCNVKGFKQADNTLQVMAITSLARWVRLAKQIITKYDKNVTIEKQSMACTEDINRSRNYMSISVKINYISNYQKYKV